MGHFQLQWAYVSCLSLGICLLPITAICKSTSHFWSIVWRKQLYFYIYFYCIFQELEQIEENWHRETKELYNNLNKLELENRKLKDHLQDQQIAVKEEVAAVTKRMLHPEQIRL